MIGFDGVTASHLTVPADILSAAMLEDGFGGRIPCYMMWTVGLTKGPIATEAGFVFHPQRTLASAPPLDTIIVGGGAGLCHPEVKESIAAWILSRAGETRRIGSICSGIHALLPTGLLDGRAVATHWRGSGELGRRYPTLRVSHKKSLVKDGPFYTTAGLSAGLDLALALIEEDYGKPLALSVGRELMLYLAPSSPPSEAMSAPSDQSRPIDRFGELVAWIMRNLHRNLSVEILARQASMSPSHFTRAFKSVFGDTPGEFVENLRLNEARRRLSSRQKTVHSVAVSVGFSDAGAFRRAFARRAGSSAIARPDKVKTLPTSVPLSKAAQLAQR